MPNIEGFGSVHAPVAWSEGKEQTSSVAQAPPVAPRTVAEPSDAQFATGGGSHAIIEGVVLKKLVTHLDSRGYFREIIRADDEFFTEGFGQLAHSLMYPGVIKAWHVHPTQVDWWYCPAGRLQVALWDRREGSPTRGAVRELFLGEDDGGQVLKIPPGVAHGCKVAGNGPAVLFYVTSRTYDPVEEGRLPHDAPESPYDWLAGPPIK